MRRAAESSWLTELRKREDGRRLEPTDSSQVVKRSVAKTMDARRYRKMAAPTDKFKAGGVSSAVWKDEVNMGGRLVTVYKATVERRYKHSDGTWKSSGSFSRNDIPLAIFCLQRAFEAIVQRQGEEGSANGEE
jgi:hypothetical protein